MALQPLSEQSASTNNNALLYHSVGVGKRFAAIVYDSMLLFGVLFTATLIPSVLLKFGTIPTVANEQIVYDLHPLMTGLTFRLYLLSIWVIFFCWFWHKNGQSLGMQAWRLKVVNLDGSNLSVPQCLLRLFGACLSLLFFGAGYWWIWLDKDQRSWHDRLSNSKVIQLPKHG